MNYWELVFVSSVGRCEGTMELLLVLVDATGGSAGYMDLTSWSRTMRRVKAALPLVCSGERQLCQVMGTGLCGSGSFRFHGSRRALKATRSPEPPKDCIWVVF